MTQAELSGPRLERVDDLRRRLVVDIPRAGVDGPYQRRLREMGSGLRLKGFRPGKVPMSVLRQRFGQEAMQKVVVDEAGRSFRECIDRESSRPASPPEVDVREDGDHFLVRFEFDESPEVTPPDLAALELRRPEAEPTEEDYQWGLTRFAAVEGKAVPVDRGIRPGDKVGLKFRLTVGDTEIWHTKGVALPFLMLADRDEPFLEAFNGKVAGDSGSFALEFSGNHPDDRFRGKAAEVAYEIESVAAVDVSDLDAVFAGVYPDRPPDRVREALRGRVLAHARGMAGALWAMRRTRALLDATPGFPVPESLLRLEVKEQCDRMVRTVQGSFYPGREFLLWDFDKVKRDADRLVRHGLVMRALAAKIGFKNDQRAVAEQINRLAAAGGHGTPDEIVERYNQDKRFAASVNGAAVEAAVFRRLESEARVAPERLSWADIRERLHAME